MNISVYFTAPHVFSFRLKATKSQFTRRDIACGMVNVRLETKLRIVCTTDRLNL